MIVWKQASLPAKQGRRVARGREENRTCNASTKNVRHVKELSQLEDQQLCIRRHQLKMASDLQKIRGRQTWDVVTRVSRARGLDRIARKSRIATSSHLPVYMLTTSRNRNVEAPSKTSSLRAPLESPTAAALMSSLSPGERARVGSETTSARAKAQYWMLVSRESES
jgi:hypothetical protein